MVCTSVCVENKRAEQGFFIVGTSSTFWATLLKNITYFLVVAPKNLCLEVCELFVEITDSNGAFRRRGRSCSGTFPEGVCPTTTTADWHEMEKPGNSKPFMWCSKPHAILGTWHVNNHCVPKNFFHPWFSKFGSSASCFWCRGKSDVSGPPQGSRAIIINEVVQVLTFWRWSPFYE